MKLLFDDALKQNEDQNVHENFRDRNFCLVCIVRR